MTDFRTRLMRRVVGVPPSIQELNRSLWLLGSLRRAGWHASLSGLVRCADGSPLPWFTYPAIESLTPRLEPSISVFEWGAGASTLFFSTHVRNVVSIEHDRTWISQLRPRLKDNVRLVEWDGPVSEHGEGGAYASLVHTQGTRFDIIVIDALFRRACLVSALPLLREDVLVIFDNAHRRQYDLATVTMPSDCARIDFFGYPPGGSELHCTAVFMRRDSRWLDPRVSMRDTGF